MSTSQMINLTRDLALAAILAGDRTEQQLADRLGIDPNPTTGSSTLWVVLNNLVCSGLLYMKVVDAQWHYLPTKKARRQAADLLAEHNCSYRDDPGHDHEQCLEQHAADIAAGLTLNAKDCMRRTAGDFIAKRGPKPAFATTETIRHLRDLGLTVYTGDDHHLTDLGRLVVDALRRVEAVTSR